MIQLEVSWPAGAATYLRDRADDEGRFVLLLEEDALAREVPDRVVLTAEVEGRSLLGRARWSTEIVDGAVLAALVLDMETAVPPGPDVASAGNDPADAATGSIPAPLPAKNFALVVTDETGLPLVGATVDLAGDAPRAQRSRSDAYGALALAVPESASFDLLVSRSGYATRLVHADRGTTDQPCVVALERGHDLEIEVVDAEGLLLEGLEIEAHTEEIVPAWTAASLGGGRYRLTGLASDPLLLGISRGESRQTVRIDPLAERVRITLDAPDEHGDS
jgi:hypothetical protein